MPNTSSCFLLLDYKNNNIYTYIDKITYFESIELISQILLLVQKLLQPITEYYICIVKSTVFFIKVVILILYVFILVSWLIVCLIVLLPLLILSQFCVLQI